MEVVKEILVQAMRSKRERIRIAIQKDGRLRTVSLGILKACIEACGGTMPDMTGRNGIRKVPNLSHVEILEMRTGDMPSALNRKDVEYAFVGTDTLREQGSKARIAARLGTGFVELKIMVRKDSPIQSIVDLKRKSIATKFPRILNEYLDFRGVKAGTISYVQSVEIIVASSKHFDAGCDLVETGESMRAYNLRSIASAGSFETVLAEST